MSSPMPFIVIGGMLCLSSSVGAALMMGGGKEEGAVCTPEGTKDPNATYKYDADGDCAMTCKTGFTKEDGACVEDEPVFDNEFGLVEGETVQCASNGPKPQAHAAYRYVGDNRLRWYGTGAEMESWDAGPATVIDDCTGLSRGSPWQMGMKP
jgi:hypothetical protein